MIENTSFQVKEGGVRLDAALLLAFPTSTRAFVREAIAKGDVRVDGRPAPKGLKLRGTETVQVVALAEAADNMVAIVCCNTYAFTSPLGGADRLIGTNPIVVGVPAGQEYPMVLDMSTTAVAMGKIQAAEREGQAIPAEWAKDYDGNPTTDPSKAFSLTPIAAHKGYGLAVMVDVLSTMFSGAAFGTDIGLFSKLEKENTGFCLIMIDPSKFMPLEDFKAEVDRYVRTMKDGRKAPGVQEIFVPGEIEYRKFETMKKTGFEVSEKLSAELAKLSAELGAVEAGTDFETLVKHFNS